jgi:hypothetical protein
MFALFRTTMRVIHGATAPPGNFSTSPRYRSHLSERRWAIPGTEIDLLARRHHARYPKRPVCLPRPRRFGIQAQRSLPRQRGLALIRATGRPSYPCSDSDVAATQHDLTGWRASRAAERLGRRWGALDPEVRRLGQALGDHAVPLRQGSQTSEVLVVGIGVQFGDQLDGARADRRIAGDPKGATSVKMTRRLEPCASDIDAECSRHTAHGDARASQHGLQEHVARTSVAAVAAGCRMQPRPDGTGPSVDRAGDTRIVKGSRRVQRRQRTCGFVAVSLLQRSLHLAQCGAVHVALQGFLG